jgi:hypothetical protein
VLGELLAICRFSLLFPGHGLPSGNLFRKNNSPGTIFTEMVEVTLIFSHTMVEITLNFDQNKSNSIDFQLFLLYTVGMSVEN